MKILRSDLAHCPELQGAVVVIDVLRSFTTAAYALAGGAREVLALEAAEDALARRAADPRALAIGALPGGRPAPGFDVGNSPSALAGHDLSDRRVLLCSAGGTRGLVRCDHASAVLAAGLVCAGATARFLQALDPPSVTLVITGIWTDRDGDEDHACADLVEALLRGADPPREAFADRVRASDFGRRFAAGRDAHLPPADLDCCAAVDRFDFALLVEPTEAGLRLVAAREDAARGLRQRRS